MNLDFLRRAIDLAVENVRRGGGPFGAVVVRNGTVLATGANQVTRSNDPTAHAEVVAIREACRTLGTHQLTGCEVYSSCEPCPMCLGALYWARPDRVYYAATQDHAARAGFDDSFIHSEFRKPAEERTLPLTRIEVEGAMAPFEAWAA